MHSPSTPSHETRVQPVYNRKIPFARIIYYRIIGAFGGQVGRGPGGCPRRRSSTRPPDFFGLSVQYVHGGDICSGRAPGAPPLAPRARISCSFVCVCIDMRPRTNPWHPTQTFSLLRSFTLAVVRATPSMDPLILAAAGTPYSWQAASRDRQR